LRAMELTPEEIDAMAKSMGESIARHNWNFVASLHGVYRPC
jgi:hypothetical protein